MTKPTGKWFTTGTEVRAAVARKYQTRYTTLIWQATADTPDTVYSFTKSEKRCQQIIGLLINFTT